MLKKKASKKPHKFVRISKVRAYLLIKAIKRQLRELEKKTQ